MCIPLIIILTLAVITASLFIAGITTALIACFHTGLISNQYWQAAEVLFWSGFGAGSITAALGGALAEYL